MECERIPAPQSWAEATPALLETYRLHIQFCSPCRARVLAEAPDELLFDIRANALPDDFWLGFSNSILHKIPAAPIPKFRYLSIRWAAVLVVGFLILLYGRNLPESEPVRTIELQSYPVIEKIENPQARYYIFQSGERGKIVMVFDPEMDL